MLIKTAIWSGILGAAVVSMTGTAQADHFTHRHRLVDDIQRLHEATDHFHREARIHAGYSHLTSEAKHLLKAIDHFCDTAKTDGSLRHLKLDFQEASTEMRHAQSELRRAWHVRRDPHMLQAWAAVERAFDRVYFDLYQTHCHFIQYHCTIPVPHVHGGHGHSGHIHGGHGHGHHGGGVQVHVGGHHKAPIWAHILHEVLK